jgi:hypothetical protein
LSLKIEENGSHREDLLFGEFRIDRERETVLTQSFSDREMALFVTEMRVGFLEVDRQRVVNGSLDAEILQARANAIALGGFNHVAMPNAL